MPTLPEEHESVPSSADALSRKNYQTRMDKRDGNPNDALAVGLGSLALGIIVIGILHFISKQRERAEGNGYDSDEEEREISDETLEEDVLAGVAAGGIRKREIKRQEGALEFLDSKEFLEFLRERQIH
jgi:hypothetical protein